MPYPSYINDQGLEVQARFPGHATQLLEDRGRLRFFCDGWCYVLHDYFLAGGRRTRLTLEDPGATHRAFAMAGGSRQRKGEKQQRVRE